MIYLAIDYGKSRIGLAVGSLIPKPLSIIAESDSDSAINKIKLICEEYEVDQFVIGMPTRSQGEEGTMASEIRKFAEDLKIKTNIDYVFEEEQFTTTEAEDYIERHDIKNKKEVLDSIAAAILLEQYLGDWKS